MKALLASAIILSVLLTGGCVECGDGVCQAGEISRCPEDCRTLDNGTASSTESAVNGNPFILEAGDYDFAIRHGGLDRRYLVHVPASYDKSMPTPLVLVFHGGGGNPEGVIKQSQMNVKSDSAGFIAAYPEGTGPKLMGNTVGTWNAVRCCGQAKDNNIDDVGFVAAMLDDLETKFNVDGSRVYATGHSNGALFSYRLACELSDRIAAVAPNAAQDSLDDCSPPRPVSIMHFHGTGDQSAPYGGGHCGGKTSDEGWDCSPVEDYLQKWSQTNGCGGDPETTYINGNATCISYMGCAEETEVTLCTINGSGHTWPGGQYLINTPAWKQRVGAITNDINANDMMWEFFKKHPIK